MGTDTFTVADGVTEVSFDLFGAEGASAPGFVAPAPPNIGAPGGLGGETRATLAVTQARSPGHGPQSTLTGPVSVQTTAGYVLIGFDPAGAGSAQGTR